MPNKKAIMFIDLDDTIFQTKRKNQNGIIAVTEHQNPNTVSYMTRAQEIFTDIFFSYPDLEIIPVTARNKEQYFRTSISKDKRVKNYVTCFGSDINNNQNIDEEWSLIVKEKYLAMTLKLNDLLENIMDIADDNFNIHISDNNYIVIKNKSKDIDIYASQNDQLKASLAKILNKEYFIHFNSNHLAIVPQFVNKRHAVEYLINKLSPELTIGAGDSISDYSFMSLCDYKIIPSNSQIEKLLLHSEKINEILGIF